MHSLFAIYSESDLYADDTSGNIIVFSLSLEPYNNVLQTECFLFLMQVSQRKNIFFEEMKNKEKIKK